MSDAGDVRDWWRDNPMTYAAEHGRTGYRDGQYEMGTAEFFDRLDQEFYSWNRPLHGERPFDRLFPYADYGDGEKSSRDRLRPRHAGDELGAQWRRHYRGGSESVSVEQTRKRFDLMGLKGASNSWTHGGSPYRISFRLRL